MTTIQKTLFIGKVWHHSEDLASTNDLAATLVANGAIPLSPDQNLLYTEGVVLTTFNQTAGRGQMGNRWLAAPNQNIAFTVVLQPTFLQAREQFHLNKAIALAVHDFFDCLLSVPQKVHLSVKWANDIYYRDKKIAGILIQNSLAGTSLQHAIIGIGLNINQLEFPLEFRATSLSLETGQVFELPPLVESLAYAVECRYWQVKARQFGTLHAEYLNKLYRYGQEALYQYPDGEIFTGKIVGISDTGKLEILKNDAIERFDIKEIKFIHQTE